MKVSYEVDFTEFNHTFQEYAKYMDKALPDVVRQQTGLLAHMLMQLTPPMLLGGGQGLTKEARLGGERRVDTDIRKVFRPIREMHILHQIADGDMDDLEYKKRQIARHVRNDRLRELILAFKATELKKRQLKNYLQKQISLAEKPHVVDLASRDLHDAAKRNGKVADGVKPIYVRNYKTVDKYIKERQRSVGRLKAGWFFAAKKIKVSKYTPVWVTRQLASLGSGEDKTANSVNPQMVLTNYIADRDRMSTKFGSVQKAVDIQERNMRAVISRIAKRRAGRSFTNQR